MLLINFLIKLIENNTIDNQHILSIMSSNAGKTPHTSTSKISFGKKPKLSTLTHKAALPVTFKWIHTETLERYKADTERLRSLRSIDDKIEDTCDLMRSEYPNTFKDYPVGKHARTPYVTLNDLKLFLRNYFTSHSNISAYEVFDNLVMKNDELEKEDTEYFHHRGVSNATHARMTENKCYLSVKPLHQWTEWLE